MRQYLLISTRSSKREVLPATSFLWKNIAFSVYKSPIYEQSSRVIEKRKRVTLEKYLRIPAVKFLFRYHVLLLRYFTGTEKSAFQAKLAKIGQFFVYNFAKKMRIETSKKLTLGKKKIYNIVLNFDSSTIRWDFILLVLNSYMITMQTSARQLQLKGCP